MSQRISQYVGLACFTRALSQCDYGMYFKKIAANQAKIRDLVLRFISFQRKQRRFIIMLINSEIS